MFSLFSLSLLFIVVFKLKERMDLGITTWNVNGLKNKLKSNRVGHILMKHKLDIICLQETHVSRKHRRVLTNKKLGTEFISSDKCKKREVVIYVKPRLEPKMLFKDEEGRIVIIQVMEQGEKLVVIGIYAPNDNKAEFYQKKENWRKKC